MSEPCRELHERILNLYLDPRTVETDYHDLLSDYESWIGSPQGTVTIASLDAASGGIQTVLHMAIGPSGMWTELFTTAHEVSAGSFTVTSTFSEPDDDVSLFGLLLDGFYPGERLVLAGRLFESFMGTDDELLYSCYEERGNDYDLSYLEGVLQLFVNGRLYCEVKSYTDLVETISNLTQ